MYYIFRIYIIGSGRTRRCVQLKKVDSLFIVLRIMSCNTRKSRRNISYFTKLNN
nr:MAG TPA: hypothetical protein [Caudoviricetes sp.]